MKTLTFKYTKADGSVSYRTLLVMVSPNTMYEGLDISELEPLEMADVEVEINKAYSKYLSDIADIKQEFDIKHNYRRFDPSKMTEVNELETV
ncbi:hypothetical protein EB001_02900 [bacterium]|nr:hypothetical protein [bacterium]